MIADSQLLDYYVYYFFHFCHIFGLLKKTFNYQNVHPFKNMLLVLFFFNYLLYIFLKCSAFTGNSILY